MIVKKLDECVKFVSGDGVILRELLHRDKGALHINYSLAHALLYPGKESKAHKLKTSEVYYIINGGGIMHIDKEFQRVAAGDTIYIPPDSVQYIKNDRDDILEFLCIVDPAWMKEYEEILG